MEKLIDSEKEQIYIYIYIYSFFEKRRQGIWGGGVGRERVSVL